jgi:hypothetical protein
MPDTSYQSIWRSTMMIGASARLEPKRVEQRQLTDLVGGGRRRSSDGGNRSAAAGSSGGQCDRSAEWLDQGRQDGSQGRRTTASGWLVLEYMGRIRPY